MLTTKVKYSWDMMQLLTSYINRPSMQARQELELRLLRYQLLHEASTDNRDEHELFDAPDNFARPMLNGKWGPLPPG